MMDVKAISTSITQTDADTVIGYVFQDDHEFSDATSAINNALGGLIAELMESGEFSGKAEQVTVIYTRGAMPAKRVVLVGLGTLEEFTLDGLRRAAAVGVKQARDLKAVRVASTLAGTEKGGLSAEQSAHAITEGALLGLYYYHGQRTGDAPENKLESLELLGDGDHAPVEAGIAQGRAYAEGTILARDLVNLPPNICTPSYLAERATKMAEAHGLKCEVLVKSQIEALKMGALLAVAQGSDAPPRFIILEHNADKVKSLKTVVLVGKGVTFDTGGYSLKTRDGMIGMKADMGGAAAVIGAMQTVAMLDLPLHVVGLVPSADNMISGHAYRPQEVITASNGTTIEIISTDAEGRMLLADALVYAKRYSAEAVVDIATLTGSCVVALGHAAAGFFSIDDVVSDKLCASGDATGERVWQLPLYPEYKKAIETQTADIKNSGGAMNGVGTSAMFLRQFVDYPAWAHVDMAGMMLDAEGNAYIPVKGGTGYGSRLLAEFARQWSE
ncbi:MAG: leucyl aminopeptidase [Aggregatilineales bacterium]